MTSSANKSIEIEGIVKTIGLKLRKVQKVRFFSNNRQAN